MEREKRNAQYGAGYNDDEMMEGMNVGVSVAEEAGWRWRGVGGKDETSRGVRAAALRARH